jgi:hypothetical protein
MLGRWIRRHSHARVLRADAHAARLVVAPLLARLAGYLPWTGHALRPFAVATLANDLVVNRRRAYLEFGAGVSTVLVAKVAALNGLELDLVSVEHDRAWIDVLLRILEREGLAERVRFLHCPLVDRTEPSPFGALRWYDERPLLAGLAGRPRDLVLVDGPPAGGRSASRYPAVPFLRAHGLIAEDASILLDDVHRPAERLIARSWAALTGVRFELPHGRVAYAVPPTRFSGLVD